MEPNELLQLKKLATAIRRDVLVMLERVGSGHLGGSMSIADLMSVLYGKRLAYDPENPSWEGRDRVVLSKGHAGPAWYAALAERGFFDKEVLLTLNEGGTNLPSHPDRTKTPGVDMTTGSLGQGTSVAAGIATALKLKKNDAKVYLIVGDGELNEGQCWEAFQYLAHYRLNNCIVIIDWNKRQLDGACTEVMNPFDLEEKMRAFGFKTLSVNGHDIEALDQALEAASAVKDSAVCVIMDTIKGAGIPFFETYPGNHSVKFSDPACRVAADEAIAAFEAQLAGE
ncbi:transketolase [Collinsella sp. AGMB00827]|uniref:Transketolase n=1 Tax=Collinsella ureilytica TaxID=2869515 RepID=A0ABS7MIK4_9ACTN|nr:transketolase [Collinsella urealyticum]MBY4797201.1 transketolase [Collinsella urealyticum]